MKITKIEVFQAYLPLVDGSYDWADGKSVEKYDATVVAVHTDNKDVVGYGEVVPLGPNYLASYAEGVRCGIKELAPYLLGADPTAIKVLNANMDYNLKGHPYVKSAIDMACWDILGKVCNLPVSTLLGGAAQESVVLYRAIPQRKPAEMAVLVQKYKAQGYTRFQLKLGGNYLDDIERLKQCRQVLTQTDVLVGDANTGWLSHDALKVCKAVSSLDVYIEQPCATLRECATVRKHTDLPFVLDENVEDVRSVIQAWTDNAADVVNIKISKFGGLTKAKQAVDLCIELGIAMTIEDTWGGDITTAAILHLASIAPAKLQFTATDFNAYNTVRTATLVGAEKKDGRMTLPVGPGLAVKPNWDVLGKPIMVFQI